MARKNLRLLRTRSTPIIVPTNLTPPTFTGSLEEGQTLTNNHGTWANNPTSYTYQHQYSNDGLTNWTDIPGATSATYLIPTSTYTGKYLRSGEKGVNAAGAAASFAHSAAIGPIVVASSGLTITGTGAGFTGNLIPVKPLLRPDIIIYRTTTVPDGDDYIDLQREIALPSSAPVETWIVGGTHIANFESPANGRLKFKTAGRGALARQDYSLTFMGRNSVGDSATVNVTVRNVATNKEFFMDVNTGLNTTFDDGTIAKPWRHCPRSYLFVGNSHTFTSDEVLFVKAGIQRTSFHPSATQVIDVDTTHKGTAGHPFHIELSGWGGMAVIDGSVDVTSPSSVTQAEVNGNANYASMVKYDLTSQGGAIESFQGVYNGDFDTETGTHIFQANYPTPEDPHINDQRDTVNSLGNEKYGLRNLPIASSGAGPRMYSSGTVVTVVDAVALAPFIGKNVNTLPRFGFLNNSNFIDSYYPDTYNGTDTVTFTRGLTLSSVSGKGAYCMKEHPALISAAGQFGFTRDGLTLYVWRNNTSSPVSVTRKRFAFQWGMGGYTTVSGGAIQRFANGYNRDGSTPYGEGGAAFDGYFNARFSYGIDIVGVDMRQLNTGLGVIVMGRGSAVSTAGVRESNIEYNTFEDIEANGLRFSGLWESSAPTGNKAAVRAVNDGKIRGNLWKRGGTNQTAVLIQGSNGAHVTLNTFEGIATLHGNCVSLYGAYGGGQPDLCAVVDYNDCLGSARFFTTNEQHNPTGSTLEGNFVLTPNTLITGAQNAGISPYDGFPGGEICRNLSLGLDSNFVTTAGISIGNGPALNIHNNVSNGIYLPAGWTGAVTNNLNTTVPTSTTNQLNGGTYTGNTQYSSGSEVYYYTSLTTDMITTLGQGRLGVHRSV